MYRRWTSQHKPPNGSASPWQSSVAAGPCANELWPSVLGEFRYGIAESRHRAAYEAWLESQLPHFDILAVTDETAIAYAVLRVALKRLGHPIPANDAWIAALALQYGLPVLSRDQHFDVVPNLARKSW